MGILITVDTSVEMIVETCWVCGIQFGITHDKKKAIQEHGGAFHCTNGCRLSYGESRKEKDEKEKAALRARLDQSMARARDESERADKAEASRARLKRRVLAGACALCNRTFSNVARHMAHQHPEAVEKVKLKKS